MEYSDIGHIALNSWCEIPSHYPNVVLDEFIIMPNHIHGILFLQDKEFINYHEPYNGGVLENSRDVACNASTNRELSKKMSAISPQQKSLSTIIRSYKSAVTRLARKANNEFMWQSNYHDRIIRNYDELQSIRNYIKYNPIQWENDENNLQIKNCIL